MTDASINNPIAHRAARKRAAQAGAWHYDPQLEAAAAMKRTDPAHYATLSASTKMSIGFYLSAKRAAEAEGVDTSDPQPAA